LTDKIVLYIVHLIDAIKIPTISTPIVSNGINEISETEMNGIAAY